MNSCNLQSVQSFNYISVLSIKSRDTIVDNCNYTKIIIIIINFLVKDQVRGITISNIFNYSL